MGQNLFIPTIIADRTETTDESIWVFLLTCRFVLHSYFKSYGKRLAIICVVSVLILLSGVILTPATIFVGLVGLAFIAGVFGLAAWGFYHVPITYSYTKTYLNLEQWTANQDHVLLSCAWVPADWIELPNAHADRLAEMIQSLSGQIDLGAGEEDLLQQLDQIAQLAANPSTEIVEVPYLSRQPLANNGILAALRFALPLTRAHARYVNYHTLPIGTSCTADPARLLGLRQQLIQDCEVIQHAQQHLQVQTQLAIQALTALSVTTNAFPDVGYAALADSSQKLNDIDLRQRLESLLMTTLQSIQDEIQPDTNRINEQYAILLRSAKETYDLHREHAQEICDGRLEEIDREIGEIDEMIEDRQNKIAALEQAAEVEENELNHQQYELHDTPPTLATPVNSPADPGQAPVYAFSVNVQHMSIKQGIQQLQTRLSDKRQQIEAYRQEIKIRKHSRERQQERRKKIEEDFKQKLSKYLDDYSTACGQLESAKLAEIQRLEKPLTQLRDARQCLLLTTNRFRDTWQIPLDPALTRYSARSEQIVDYRKRIITIMSERAVQQLDALQGRLEQTLQTIDSYLWPTHLLSSFDHLSIPIWLVRFRDDQAKEHLMPISLCQFSALPNDASRTPVIDPIVPVMKWVHSLVSLQPYNITQILPLHNAPGNIATLQRLQQEVSTKFAAKEIDLFSMIVARAELFRQRLGAR